MRRHESRLRLRLRLGLRLGLGLGLGLRLRLRPRLGSILAGQRGRGHLLAGMHRAGSCLIGACTLVL